MSALTAERNTPRMEPNLINVPVAEDTKVFAGGIAVANASGYATPGAAATTLTYLGRFDESVDNTGGEDGDKSVLIRRGVAFQWDNSSADPVTQASLGKACYIVDDQTVAATAGVVESAATRSAAGIVVGIDADGVWVL